jgi:hypothetical protein
MAVGIAIGSTTVGIVRGGGISEDDGTMISTLQIGHTIGLPAWRHSTERGFLQRPHRKKMNMGMLPRAKAERGVPSPMARGCFERALHCAARFYETVGLGTEDTIAPRKLSNVFFSTRPA